MRGLKCNLILKLSRKNVTTIVAYSLAALILPYTWLTSYVSAMLEQKTWCSSCCANSNPPWATVLTAFHISSNKMAFLLACRLCTATMSGLCPPVPTELVSVFYLTTGSVQQEQECSLKTGRICVHVASSSLNAGKQPGLLFVFTSTAERREVFPLSHWPWFI